MWVLCATCPVPDYFLVQNPPTIPTFMVVQFVCWLRGASMVIDWHNFGYTLLGLQLGAGHPFVRIYKWHEHFFGRRAHGHLCVTSAMQHELKENWDILATVLYDRPPEFFRRATLEEKHQLFMKLNEFMTKMEGPPDWCDDLLLDGHGVLSEHNTDIGQGEGKGGFVRSLYSVENTLVTSRLLGVQESALGVSEDRIALRKGRPAVIVSSTSW